MKNKTKKQNYTLLFKPIKEALEAGHWNVAICEPNEEDSECPGIIFGNKEYLDYILGLVEKDREGEKNCE